MRLMIAGWQGQLARCLMKGAFSHRDVTACAIGRPALDLCEPPTIHRNLADVKPDVIINAAAYTAVDQAETDADAAFALNRDGARLLAEAAAERGVPFIHVSTDYVFDGTKPGPYVETDTPSPQCVYGHSKLEGENAVLAANPDSVILRTAWVYSAHGKNFATTMLGLAKDRSELSVVDDQRGSPTYAPHLADAVLDIAAIVSKRRAAGEPIAAGIYHAAGTGNASWRELAEAIFDESARQGGRRPIVKAITTADYPTAAKRPANSVLDCSKLRDAFGITLPDWRMGVVACIAAIRDAESEENNSAAQDGQTG